ncbi:G5 domain-containing protein [Kallipyga massiliensis]|uniref:G5 domain-containing protein n=1 Tax=Kallipyga massiliensis TaxID=1472764 RepID=UPI0004ACD403|nr:G5 domain-containing protein [Kallipyga massiliensis]
MKRRTSFVILCLGGLLLTSCSPGKKYDLVDPPEDLLQALRKEVREEKLTVDEEYPIRAVADLHLEPGEMKIIQMGQRGQSEVTFRITSQDGKDLFREALSEKVIRRAQPAIVHFGPRDREKYPDGSTRTVGYSQPQSEVELELVLTNAGLFEPGQETAANTPPPAPAPARPASPNPKPAKPPQESSQPAQSESSSHPEESADAPSSGPNKPTTKPEKPPEESQPQESGEEESTPLMDTEEESGVEVE